MAGFWDCRGYGRVYGRKWPEKWEEREILLEGRRDERGFEAFLCGAIYLIETRLKKMKVE